MWLYLVKFKIFRRHAVQFQRIDKRLHNAISMSILKIGNSNVYQQEDKHVNCVIFFQLNMDVVKVI